MPLLLNRSWGLDALQPMAAGIEDEPAPEPRGGNAPPVINTYDPGVERWRDPIWEAMPDDLKTRPDAPLLLDKALHAVRGESGGDPGAVGDGGVAHGLFQSHYVGANASPDQQIADAWRLISGDLQNGGTGFGDWGEGRSYQGGSFGAFGRTPYGSGSGGQGFAGITWGGGSSQPASSAPAPPALPDQSLFAGGSPAPPYQSSNLAQHLSTGQTRFSPLDPSSPEDYQTILEQTQLGLQPPVSLDQTPSGLEDIAAGSRGTLRGTSLLGQTPPSMNPTVTTVPQGYTESPLTTLSRVGQPAMDAYNYLNTDIPVVSPALRGLQSGVRAAVSPAVTSVLSGPLGGLPANIASDIGGERLPILGPVLRARREALNSAGEFTGEQTANLVPTRALDIGLAAAPFAGEAGDLARTGLQAGRGVLERTALEGLGEELPRAPAAAATVEGRLAARGRVPPAGASPDEMTPEERLAFGDQPTAESTGMRSVEPNEPVTGRPLSEVPTEELQRRLNAAQTVINNTQREADALIREEGLSHNDPEVLAANQHIASAEDVWTQINDELARRGAYEQRFPGPTGQGVQSQFTPGEAAGGQGPTSGELQSAYSPFDKLMNAVSSASEVPEANAAAFSQQRAQRTATWYSVRDRALAEGKTMAEATAEAEPYLRQSGELTRADFEPLHQAFTPEDLNTLRSEPGYALDDGRLKGPYEVHNTQDALEKVLRGDFGHLAEHELGLLRTVYGPQLADSIAARTAQLGGPQGLASALHYYAGRGLANLLSFVDSFTTTATFGHLTPLRFGFGQLFSPNPAERAAAREAWVNMYRVLFNPKNADIIAEGLRADPLIAGEGFLSPADAALAEEAERRGIQFQNFRPRGSVDDTAVNTFLKKLGLSGNRFSQATRAYLDTIQMRSYADGARALMMGEDAAGQVLAPREYRGLYDSLAHIVGKSGSIGEFGTNIPSTGNPAFSLQALIARYKRIFDPVVQPGSINPLAPGARAAAIRGWIGTGLAGASTAALAQATGLGTIDSDLKIHFAGHTLDPFSGSSSALRSIYNLEQAVMGAKDVPDAADRIIQSAQRTARGQVSPGWDFILSLLNKKDWQGRPMDLKQDVESLLMDSTPLGPHSIYDMLKAGDLHGVSGLAQAIGAGTAALLGSSVETPDTLTANRDAEARKLGFQDYASAGKANQDKIDQSPAITSYKQEHPTDYDLRKQEVQAPLDQEERQGWDAFYKGENQAKITDILHTNEDHRFQAARDLSTQFAKQFSGFSQDKYQKAVQGYYDIQKTFADGTPDFDSQQKARDAYVAKLPADQQQWLKEALTVTESHRSPERQKYDKYIADKKAAGYFDLKPTDDNYQQKHDALDLAHPDLDAQAWLYGGTKGVSGGELRSKAAVDQALGMKLPNRPIVLGSLDRDLSTPEGRKLWADQGTKLANLVEMDKYVARDGDAEAQLQYRRGNVSSPHYADLSDNEKAKVQTAIRKFVLDSSPEMEALWAYAGGGGSSQDKVYSVSREAVPYLKDLASRYGNTPPKEGWKIVVKR